MPGADDYVKIGWLTDILHLPQEDKDQLFLRMVFNYVAGISDDHNKNFTFLMDKSGRWQLSPAYDVMFSANVWENPSAGIHSMGVMGKRSALTINDFIDFAEDFVDAPEAKIQSVFQATAQFRNLCEKYDIDKDVVECIQRVIDHQVHW